MANEAKFIGLENVQSVANKLSPNIVIGPAFYMADELNRLGIKVETGVQYQLTKTVFAGKGGQTRRKEVGNVKESKLGYLFSRKLTANICVHRIRCNEDDFQEKPGNIAINGSAEMHFEKTELFMTEQASLFAQDIFNNIIGGAGLVAYCEAYAFAAKAGIDLQTTFDATRCGFAGGPQYDNKIPKLIKRDYEPGARVAVHRKDIINAKHFAHKLGVDLPLTDVILMVMDWMNDNGHINEDQIAMVKYYEDKMNVKVGEEEK